ncbi:hypothetical protein BN140_0455 [Methanoculleus bourgensis MS2]|uniref:Uncharacterized protein n=1 Tax=Methanoculleus bourgensis (strain ATCC 43281 / DSM 3045 / OCM 15 / MS2) TaxID=1201294 RepID=I7J7F9_METBM|nr:hypothetical protein BN140_0455 [Methanoculleus bourgensis MS2]
MGFSSPPRSSRVPREMAVRLCHGCMDENDLSSGSPHAVDRVDIATHCPRPPGGGGGAPQAREGWGLTGIPCPSPGTIPAMVRFTGLFFANFCVRTHSFFFLSISAA